jgi:hypothetical protein
MKTAGTCGKQTSKNQTTRQNNTNPVKEKKKLYEQAMELLEGCNVHLQDDPELPTLNSLMASVVKNLNNVLIKTLTGINSEDVK